MSLKRQGNDPVQLRVRRRDGLLTPHAIGRLARLIAERFQPEKIILFGSYAYGNPNLDSDVDLLVVMPVSNEINQAIRIRHAFWLDFPWDVLVRTPERLERRIKWGDWFLKEIVSQGRVLYEKGNRRLGSKRRKRPATGDPC